MPTLGELMRQFNSELGEKTAVAHDPTDVDAQLNAALERGSTKTASAGGSMTLQDIYLQMMGMDKAAAAVSSSPVTDDPTEEELAAAAEKLAADEADALLAGEGGDTEEPTNEEILKVARDYDAAGRIMFRGFYDEFLKEASKLQAANNQHTERESAAKTPALGNRGLPTLETNYAGSPNHDVPLSVRDGKDTYRSSLQPSKRISAGVTGDDPEAAAISLGGGAPMGFATVRDLMVRGG